MRGVVAVVMVATLWAGQARACLWDADTLAVEAAAMPGVLEAISGNFPRHSRAYYEWRVRDRLALIRAGRKDLSLYDDLVVSYEKLGQTEEALVWVERAAARLPDRYETEANWGTVLIHAGRYDEGLAHLRRAVTINPDAHFGRERYQILLVEYVLARRSLPNAPALPLSPWPRGRGRFDSFASMVLRAKLRDSDDDKELAAATRGVVGMIRFGTHDSPVLMEALGDLLAAQGKAHLASRAYVRAALTDTAVEDAYINLGNQVAPYTPAEIEKLKSARGGKASRGSMPESQPKTESGQASERLIAVHTALLKEIAIGDELQRRIAADEARWIKDMEDVDARFRERYLKPAATPAAD